MNEPKDSSGGWDGYRTFCVERKEPESRTVTSFYLTAKDARPLAPYKPGQFLGFKLDVPGHDKPVLRTYTISDSSGDATHYRLSIKREPPPPDQPDAPPGVSSNYFHDHVEVGGELQVRAPSGDFFLLEDDDGDGDGEGGDSGLVVLLSGGVGLTPMVSMLNHIVSNGAKRPVWFVHGVRNGDEHAFGAHVRGLAETHANVHAHIAYLEPCPGDVEDRDYDSAGVITMELLQSLLPGKDGDFYLCGPPPFMKSLFNGLLDWGVVESRIYYEFFGPATVLKKGAGDKADQEPAPASPGPEAAADGPVVTFKRSGVTVNWDPDQETILELAEANGLAPDFSCRSGVCHTCMCTLIEGEIEYVNDDAFLPEEEGQILICSSKPKTDITVDV
ncbi:MAG: 2Fe-2S iron-sulfur cluster binding domain-containing protein [Proteobacteria bacterium]|nr:2Fe-2S iron-sulfur cluster binding domain-containing protein [Pseudomonadota bacterium]